MPQPTLDGLSRLRLDPDPHRRATPRHFPTSARWCARARARTWREFDRRINKIARTLAGMGIGQGDKIAILADNSIEYLETFMGGLRAGACVVPLSTMAAADALEKMLDDCDAKVLFLSDQYRGLVEPYEERLAKLIPGGRIAYDFERAGLARLRGLAGRRERRCRSSCRSSQLDDFNIIYCSGTTGLPKGILHTHAMRDLLAVRFTAFDYGPDTISLASTPLYSNTTLVAVLATLGVGGTTILMPKSDVVKFLEIAQRERVTHAMLVPVQYQRILAHPDFDRYDLGAFKCKLSTSAPLRAQIKADCREALAGPADRDLRPDRRRRRAARSRPTSIPTSSTPSASRAWAARSWCSTSRARCCRRARSASSPAAPRSMMKGYYKQDDKTRDLFWYDDRGPAVLQVGRHGPHRRGRLRRPARSQEGHDHLRRLQRLCRRHRGAAAEASRRHRRRGDRHPERAVGRVADGAVRAPRRRRRSARPRSWRGPTTSSARPSGWSASSFASSLPRSTIGKIMKRELREPYWAGRSARFEDHDDQHRRFAPTISSPCR